jgi:hypothetical protein
MIEIVQRIAEFEDLFAFLTTASSEGFRVNFKIRQEPAQRKHVAEIRHSN